MKQSKSGVNFEHFIENLLNDNGFTTIKGKFKNKGMPKQKSGHSHRIDIRLDDGTLISCKYQDNKSGGTAEEKIPFEIIKLQNAIEDSNGLFKSAIIVLGGDGWRLKDWYLSTEFREYMDKCGWKDVKIYSKEIFIKKFNLKVKNEQIFFKMGGQQEAGITLPFAIN